MTETTTKKEMRDPIVKESDFPEKSNRFQELMAKYRNDNPGQVSSFDAKATTSMPEVKVSGQLKTKTFDDLSPEVQERLVARIANIDYTVSSAIQQYGSLKESPLTENSSQIIAKYSASDFGEISSSITELVASIKTNTPANITNSVKPAEYNEKWGVISSLREMFSLKKARKRLQKALSQQQSILKNIQAIEVFLQKQQLDLQKDVEIYEQMGRDTYSQLSDLEDELPNIDTYPFKVEGKGEINIEIFSSPEKAGSENSNGNDEKANTWLIDIVQKFNKAGYTVDGKSVSVSLRSVSSGLMVDYITSGAYIPDGITPSNEDWASMLTAKGVSITKEAESLVKNTAGIVLQKDVYDRLNKEYGSVNSSNIIDATVNGKLAMGYTNPYASSTGLNFLVTSLYCFDSSNPLSEEAVKGFQSFQANVPVVSYNTVQMQGAINSGVLEGMILEHQTYINKSELRNYEFVPFGIRHDNPLYSVGNLSSEKKEAFKIFAEFATNEDAQKSAEEYGFGGNANYVSETPASSGNLLLDAQQLWKDKKDGDQEIVAVFIVDTSGSVDGAPLNQMKTSLINAGQYIKTDAYVGLVSYSNSVTVNLPIDKFDLNQRAYFNGEIDSFTAGGGTATFDAIAVGLQMLEKERENHPDAKFMLFVLSDGNSDGNIKNVQSFIENLKVPVYTIGYNANVEALKQISSINEAASINADTDDIIYKLKSLFNAEM